jgi:hypothetical protein
MPVVVVHVPSSISQQGAYKQRNYTYLIQIDNKEKTAYAFMQSQLEKKNLYQKKTSIQLFTMEYISLSGDNFAPLYF